MGASISRLFTYAAYADKFGGEVQETPLYGMTAKTEGVGVSIETTTGSSQALAAALAVGSDWKKAI